MATNLVNYIGNLGKSVGYSTVEKFKTMAPSTTEFVSTNAELYKNVYENIRDYRNTYKRSSDAIKKSKLYEAGQVGITAIFEDIASGKLYNKERQDAMDTKALGMDDSSDEWGSFDIDDSAFDIGGDDEFGDFSEGEKGIVKSVEATSKSNANAVSMAVARTGEYIVESNKAQTNLLFTQNMHAFGNLNNAVGALNENVGKVLEFSNNVLKTHAENSQKYFETTTQLIQNQTALLTRIADRLAPVKEEKKSAEKIQYEDVVGVNGTPNMSLYMKNINNNIKRLTEQYLPNMNITGDKNANPFLSLVAQPLKIIPDYFVSKMIPDMVEKSVQSFDNSSAGFFGSLMSKFNTMSRKENNPLASFLGKIFGINNSLKTDIDVSGYEKGKVDWDGRSKKALEEVIPTHLSRIESLLSGKSEQRFDYDTGKFVKARDIKERLDNEKKRYSTSSTDELSSLFKEYMKVMTFNSKGEKESLEKDIEKIFDYMYKNNKIFEVNDKNFDDLYTEYGVDSRNLRLFRAMFRQAPNDLKMQLSGNIMSGRQKQSAAMEKYQKEGSIYNNLFNDLPVDEFIKRNKNTGEKTPLGLLGKSGLLTELKDNLGHNIYFYLQNINKELSFIRKKGIGYYGNISDKPARTSIYANGKEVYLDEKEYTFGDESIEDNSTKSKSREYADKKYREQKSYRNAEDRRRKKDSSLFNVSEFKGEDKDFENRLKSILETKDVERKIKEAQEKEKKKNGFIDSLLGESTLGGKLNTFITKGQSILNKPMEFIANVFNRADQRMYEMIYGTETGEEGFMTMFKRKTKETFQNINNWLDENILEPLKRKLQIENFRDLGKKFFGLFGIDLNETGKNIKGYFFGNKDTGEKGLFSDIKDGFKDTFGGVAKGIKDAIKGTISDITRPFKDRFKSKKKVFKEQAEDDEETTVDESSVSSINPNIKRTSDIIDGMYGSKYKSSGATEDEYASMFDLLNGEDFNYDEKIEDIKKQLKSNSKAFSAKKGNTDGFLDNKGNRRFARKYLKQKKSLQQQMADLKNRRQNMLSTIENKYTYDQGSIDFKDMLETIGIDTSKMNPFQLETLKRRLPNMEEAGIDDLLDTVSGISGIEGNADIINDYKNKAIKSAATGDNKITLSEIQKFKYKKDEDRKDPDYFINEFKELIDKSKEDMEDQPKVQVESRNYLKDIRDFLLGLRKGTSSSKSSDIITDPSIKPDRDLEEHNILQEKAKGLSDVIMKFLQGNTSQHAEGSNVLKQAEVSTLKPGELVLNPDEVKSVSSLVDSLAKALGTAGNKLSDISSDNYKKFTKLKNKLGDRFDISDAEQFMSDKTKEKYGNVIKLDQYKKVVSSMSKQYDIDNDLDENGEPKDPIQKALYKDVKPFVTLMGEEASSAFKSVKKSLFGTSPEDESKRFSDMMTDLSENVSEYAPKALPAAVLGSGVSLITGAIGGPLLGAAIGAGASLTLNSEKAQQWLFGEKIADERTGGVIPKSVVNAVSKYMPDMSKYGISGSLAGLFTPLGPVGGLLMGSAIGFAKNNDGIQEALFGEKGLFDEKQKEKLKKMLPRLGLGALVGATVGPFGLIGNALAGAGVGFLTTSNKFTELFIGKYNENTDRYENGILPALRESMVDPLKNFGQDIKTKIMEFIDKDMISPVKRAMEPFKKDAKLLINGVGRIVGKSLDFLFERSFGVPLSKLANSLTKKVTGFATGLFTKLLTPTKAFLSAPFKFVGKVGDWRRNSQINNGNADYMTAEERLAYKGDRDYKFRNLDEYIAGGDNNLEGMQSFSDSIRSFQDLSKTDSQKRKDLANETGEEVIKHFGYRDSSAIQRSFRDGNYDKIDNIINKNTVRRKSNLISILKSCQAEYNRQMDKMMKKAESNNWGEKDIKYKEVHIKDDIKKKYLRDLDSATQKEILDKLKEDYETTSDDRDEDYTNFSDLMKSKIADNDKNTEEFTNYINGQKSKFDTFKSNKANKQQVIDNLQQAMLERGVNIDLSNEKEVDKVYNMIQKEIDNLNLVRNKSEDDQTDADKEKQKDVKMDKQHQEIVDLFAQAINAIKNIGKSEDEVTAPELGKDPEETIANINKKTEEKELKVASMENNIDVVVEQLKKLNEKQDETDSNGIMTKVEGGKVYQYKKEKNGDLAPNLSDSQTRQNLAADEQEKLERKGFYSSLAGLFSNKDKKSKDDEKKKTSLWDKVKDFFSGGIGKFLPAIIGMVAGGSFIKNMLANTDFRDSVVSGAKSILTGTIFPEFGDTDGNGKDAWTNSITSNGIVRDIMKGGKGLSKISAKTALKGTDILNPIKGVGKLGISGVSKVGSMLGKGVSKVTGIVDNMGVLKKVRDKISQNVAKYTNPFVKDMTKNVAEAAEKGAAGELSQKLSKFLFGLFDNSAVKKLIGENAGDIAQKFVPKFVEKISKKAAENSAKVATRLASLATTGGLLNVAFFVGDFVSGYRDAKNILGVTEDDIQELGFFYKLAAGIMKAVNGAFIITSFIPEEFYVTAIFDYLAPAVGISDSDIQQRRQATQDKVKEYNEQNGTDYNVREYNNMEEEKHPGIIKRAKNWIGDKVNQVTDWASNTAIGKKVTEVKNWVTGDENFQKASNILDKVGSYVIPSRLIKEHIFKKDEDGQGGPLNDEPIGGVSDYTSDSTFTNFNNNGYPDLNTQQTSSVWDTIRNKFSNSNGIGGINTSETSIMINSIISNVKNLCMTILNDSTVQTLIGSNKSEELANKFVPSLNDFLYSHMTSSATNLSSKDLATMMNGGTLNSLTSVQDFISGYNDAQSILGLGTDPTIGLKVCAGMIKVLGKFISVGVISHDKWVDFITDNITYIFKSEDRELVKSRQQISNRVDQSDPSNQTVSFVNQNKSVDNSGTGIIQKVKDKASSLYNTVKDKASSAWNTVKDTASNVYNSAKDSVKNFASKLGFGGPKEQDWSGFDLFSNSGKKIKSNTQSIFDGMGGGEINGIPTGTQPLSDDVKKYSDVFSSAGQKYGVDPAWMEAISMQESGGNANSDNGAALGLMQIESTVVPEFQEFGKSLGESWSADDRRDPNKAIPFAAQRLAKLLQHYNGDYTKATQAYNFSEYSLDALLKAFPEDWMSHRSEIGQYNGTGLAHYGDPKYVENVFRYYNGDGKWSGSSSSSNGSGSSSTSGGMLSDLMSLFKNSVGKAFGIDLEGTSSSSDGGNSGGTAEYQNGTVDTSSLSGTAKTVVDAAASMIGCPYVWGGTGSPLTEATVNSFAGSSHDITSNDGANGNWKSWIGKPGFDCSGLMQYAYNKANIDIGRDTNAQLASSKGTEVSVSEVQPGDLIFFGSRSNNHHVGMAIGNGKMIEAPSSGKTVRVSDIRTDAFAAKRFIKGGQGGLLEKYSKNKKMFKAKNDFANNAIGGPIDTFFSKSLKGNVTSNFGFRNTRGSIGRNHTGIDIGAKQGTDIKSPIGGVVTRKVSSEKSNGYGNLMVMKDQNGAEHYFGHMENPTNLKPGDVVKPGEKIGNVGTTGNSTGSHLHYEVKQGGISVDPNKYYKKGMGGEVDNNVAKQNSSLGNADLLKSIISILAKIAQNTVSVSDIFKLLQQGNIGQQNSTQEKANPDTNTANTTLKANKTKNDTTNLLRSMIGNQNDIGEQDLLNLVVALARQ